MINSNSITPLYLQVKEHILNDIHGGKYLPSGRLPSEKELAAMYNVSLITIRRAISELVDEQILQKKQGKGTFVTKKSFSRPYYQNALSFTEICQANGMRASAKLLQREILPYPAPEILKQLALPDGSPVLLIERLRFADGIPIVIEKSCFSMEYGFLLEADLEKNSMYQIIRENRTVDLQPVIGQRFVKITKANARIARYLNIRESTPILQYEGICWEMISDRPAHTSFQTGYGEQMDFALRF